MKTAIIHVGAHKTGSTSIQASLGLSKQQLLKEGVYYFNDYDRKAQLLSMGLRLPRRKIPPSKSKYKTMTALAAASRASWLALARHVRRNSFRYTVISEEALLRLPEPDQFARFLLRIFDRVLIVIYVRDPVALLPSSFNQRVRGGATIETFTERGGLLPRVLPKLDKYAAAFGEDNLIVRNFDRDNLVDGSPSADFACVISGIVGADVQLQEAGQRNASIPAAVTYDLLSENEIFHSTGAAMDRAWNLRRQVLIEKVRCSQQLMSGAKMHLTDPRLLGHIRGFFADDVAEINTRFLSGQIGIELGPPGNLLKRAESRQVLRDWMAEFYDARVAESMTVMRAEIDQRAMATCQM